MTCPECGRDIADDTARFCPGCGAQLALTDRDREVRRVVSVLFADIVGSTTFGEQHDPELVRSLLARYFAGARAAIERHGGTVEKFIGDAVMAVFGLPRAHEDDALRAVRAAVDLRDAVEDVNGEPGAPARVQVRIGITTGEVVAGGGRTRETLVTGDAVNTAARLQAAAEPGEIVIGATTRESLRAAVATDALGPLQLKGKEAPVHAFRVVKLRAASAPQPVTDAPLIGRDEELDLLRSRWRQVTDERRIHHVTLVAPAGVGKSRLLRALAVDLGTAATVARGRCLAYGEGITYWPVREVMFALAGIGEGDSPDAALGKLRALAPEEPDAARAVASAIGLSDAPSTREAIFDGCRRLIESVARRGPLAVLLEDLHWAEPTLLDLVEFLGRAEQPVLMVTSARDELVATRPDWARGARSEVVRLEPLAGHAVQHLFDAQPGGSAVPPELRRRILDMAEGNALYLEEMVAVLRDRALVVRNGGRWNWTAGQAVVEVPPTVHALLTARLDQLPDGERTVVERGSVAGRSFEAAALVAIDEALRPGLVERLEALVRRELLRPDAGELTPGDAYRFRHVLIRDAAYAALSRADRALLHERFADWLVRVAGDRIGEFEEIVGYHLEQAVEHRRAVGRGGPEADALAQRAAEALRAAGRAARRRFDSNAVASLLGRSTRLAIVVDAELGRDLRYLRNAEVALGRWDAANATLRQLSDVAAATGDVELRLRRELMAVIHDELEDWSPDAVRAIAGRVLHEAEEADLPAVQSAALVQLGVAELLEHRPMAEFRFLERAEAVALRDPDPLAVRTIRQFIANRVVRLPLTVDEIEAVLQRQMAMRPDPELRLDHLLGMAYVASGRDETEDARTICAEVRTMAEELGLTNTLVNSFAATAVDVELQAGDHERAETLQRELYLADFAEDRWTMSQYDSWLAWIIAFRRDRLTPERADEVDALVRSARDLGGSGLAIDTEIADQADAMVRSWRGRPEEAVPIAEAAADAFSGTDASPDAEVYARLALAVVRRAAGDAAGAREAADRVVQLAEAKGVAPWKRMAERVLTERLS